MVIISTKVDFGERAEVNVERGLAGPLPTGSGIGVYLIVPGDKVKVECN